MYVAMIFGQCSYLGPWQTHLVLDWSFVFQQVVRCYFYANEVWLLLSKRSAFVSVFFSKLGSKSLWNQILTVAIRYGVSSYSFLPWIVSTPYLVGKLFKFSLHKKKTNTEYMNFFKVLKFQKRIVVSGNYMRKYSN